MAAQRLQDMAHQFAHRIRTPPEPEPHPNPNSNPHPNLITPLSLTLSITRTLTLTPTLALTRITNSPIADVLLAWAHVRSEPDTHRARPES